MAGLIHTVLSGRSCLEMWKGRVSPTLLGSRTGEQEVGRLQEASAHSMGKGWDRDSIQESRVPRARRGLRTTSSSASRPPTPPSSNASMASVRGKCLASQLLPESHIPGSWLVGKALPQGMGRCLEHSRWCPLSPQLPTQCSLGP